MAAEEEEEESSMWLVEEGDVGLLAGKEYVVLFIWKMNEY